MCAHACTTHVHTCVMYVLTERRCSCTCGDILNPLIVFISFTYSAARILPSWSASQLANACLACSVGRLWGKDRQEKNTHNWYCGFTLSVFDLNDKVTRWLNACALPVGVGRIHGSSVQYSDSDQSKASQSLSQSWKVLSGVLQLHPLLLWSSLLVCVCVCVCV